MSPEYQNTEPGMSTSRRPGGEGPVHRSGEEVVARRPRRGRAPRRPERRQRPAHRCEERVLTPGREGNMARSSATNRTSRAGWAGRTGRAGWQPAPFVGIS
eukprot:gene5043-biopygen12179